MATATITPFLPVEEYLHTTYRPDVDYVDGHIEERNLGEFDHGALLLRIARLLDDGVEEWNIRVGVDVRLQVGPNRFRVPDVSVVSRAHPKEQIIQHPPMLCIEVLSPEDTPRRMIQRCADYFAMGVPTVWIFDPAHRRVHAFDHDQEEVQTTGLLKLPNSSVVLDLDQTFLVLDRP